MSFCPFRTVAGYVFFAFVGPEDREFDTHTVGNRDGEWEQSRREDAVSMLQSSDSGWGLHSCWMRSAERVTVDLCYWLLVPPSIFSVAFSLLLRQPSCQFSPNYFPFFLFFWKAHYNWENFNCLDRFNDLRMLINFSFSSLSHLPPPTFPLPPASSHCLLTCWPICMYVSVCAWVYSTTLPLLPGLIIVLRRERFLLVFGIHGNASFHEEQSVYGDQELLPFLLSRSGPTRSFHFPFPLHYSPLRHLPPSFLPLSYISYISLTVPPKHLDLTRPHALRIFSAFLALTFFALWFVPVCLPCPPHTCLKWIAFTHLPHGLSLLSFIEFSWNQLIHQCLCFSAYACFLPLSCRNTTEFSIISWRASDSVDHLNDLFTCSNQLAQFPFMQILMQTMRFRVTADCLIRSNIFF